MNYEPFTSIENPTLAHFRHFSSLFTLSPLYICRELSTNQLLFMQNKPNFQKSQMNVILYNTTDYENKWQWRVRKNKPNSNPIKPNLKRAKMNIYSFITKDYRKNDDFLVRINKPNLVRRRRIPKMNVNTFLQKDYENKTAFRLQKNKPKQSQYLKRMKVNFCVTGGRKLKNSRSFIGLKNFENAVYLHSSAHFLEFSREL